MDETKQPDPAAPAAPGPIPDVQKQASDVVAGTLRPLSSTMAVAGANGATVPDAEEEDLDEEEDEYTLDPDADPRLHAAVPTFRHDDAFDIAMRAGLLAACRGEYADLPPSDDPFVLAFRVVFDRIAKTGSMAAETAYRTLVAEGANIPPWEERPAASELNLAAFVAVAAALIPIADAQVAAFDLVVKELQGEERLSAMRKRRAGRRAKREARKARRPEAIRKLLATQKANRAAAGEPPAPPTKSKGKAKTKGAR